MIEEEEAPESRPGFTPVVPGLGIWYEQRNLLL